MKKEKKVHGVKLLIRTVVRDPDGKIISDSGRRPSKSLVIQFLIFVGALMDGVSTNAKAVGGTNQLIYATGNYSTFLLRCNGAINESIFGIQVGTGDTAVTNVDYKLATQLTEGAGAGNITHGTVTTGATAVVGANVDMEIKRSFVNNTGSSISVKEAGLVSKYYDIALRTHLIFRDVLPDPETVPDKCSITIFYTLRTTV